MCRSFNVDLELHICRHTTVDPELHSIKSHRARCQLVTHKLILAGIKLCTIGELAGSEAFWLLGLILAISRHGLKQVFSFRLRLCSCEQPPFLAELFLDWTLDAHLRCRSHKLFRARPGLCTNRCCIIAQDVCTNQHIINRMWCLKTWCLPALD